MLAHGADAPGHTGHRIAGSVIDRHQLAADQTHAAVVLLHFRRHVGIKATANIAEGLPVAQIGYRAVLGIQRIRNEQTHLHPLVAHGNHFFPLLGFKHVDNLQVVVGQDQAAKDVVAGGAQTVEAHGAHEIAIGTCREDGQIRISLLDLQGHLGQVIVAMNVVRGDAQRIADLGIHDNDRAIAVSINLRHAILHAIDTPAVNILAQRGYNTLAILSQQIIQLCQSAAVSIGAQGGHEAAVKQIHSAVCQHQIQLRAPAGEIDAQQIHFYANLLTGDFIDRSFNKINFLSRIHG